VVFSIWRRKGAGIKRRESWQCKIDSAFAADLLKNDRRIASRMIAERLTIPKTVALQILKKDLGRRTFFLLQDNAPAHKAASVCQVLTQKNVTTL
jgi:hypothetical protein